MDVPSARVDGDRLWRRLMALARFGARPDGAIDRQALTATEIEARREIVGWARHLGLEVATDPAANLFLRLTGRDPSLPPVLTGSHIDTQPTGGRFDGAYGVVAGLEAVSALLDAGLRPQRSIEVVAWTNEEASRFAPGMTGSGAFTGALPLERSRSLRDAQGVALGDALDALLAADDALPMLALGRPVSAFIELHIEQGPVLERERRQIGIVSGIQGTRRYRVTVNGEAAHAGTTLRADRRDALMAALRIISAIESATQAPADTLMTVGLFEVSPNAPSVVPSRVHFSIDLRHPDNTVVDGADRAIREAVALHRGSCETELVQIQHNRSIVFPASIRSVLEMAAKELNISYREMPSAAGHDARNLHAVCPTGMVFVPCRDGISHSPAEWAEPEDLAAGVRVLADTLWSLANSPDLPSPEMERL